jgi:diguanylate cyclase (GGDEF)-like protein
MHVLRAGRSAGLNPSTRSKPSEVFERRRAVNPKNELALIRTILEKVNTTLSSEKILGYAVQGIQDFFKWAGSFKVVTAKGWGYEFLKKINASPFQGLIQEMATRWEPILITRGDSRMGTEGYVFQHDFSTLLALPLSIRGRQVGLLYLRQVGLLYLSWSEEVEVDDEVQEALTDMARLCTLILDHGSLDDRVFSMSNIDPLTGLYSYKFWHEELHREISRADKLKSPITLMQINLNKFKEFNAMYGHVMGDELLVNVSEIISKELDNLYVPCRVGGKWHILLVGEDEKAARKISDRIIGSFESLSQVGSSATNLSIGLSVYKAGEAERDLIKRVDDALLEARRLGGNSCRIR